VCFNLLCGKVPALLPDTARALRRSNTGRDPARLAGPSASTSPGVNDAPLRLINAHRSTKARCSWSVIGFPRRDERQTGRANHHGGTPGRLAQQSAERPADITAGAKSDGRIGALRAAAGDSR
jgi:hypothetical protein